MAIVSVIQAVAALYVLGVTVLALNRMSPATRHLVRWSYLALAGGAMAAVASCFGARDVFECIFAVGVALYMAVDRRKAKT
ncbi:MAG: hypothetical protein K2X55_21900 [Burkholderiaceae bacterium]|nr:hypothetical protein [Burkholderiaceae bacterium]